MQVKTPELPLRFTHVAMMTICYVTYVVFAFAMILAFLQG